MGVGKQQGDAVIQRKDQRVIFGDHADEGEACGVDGIIDGGVKSAQKFLAHAVHCQMQPSCGEGAQLGNGVLGIPEGRGVGAGYYYGSVSAADGQLETKAKACGSIHKAEVKFFFQRLHKALHAGNIRIFFP